MLIKTNSTMSNFSTDDETARLTHHNKNPTLHNNNNNNNPNPNSNPNQIITQEYLFGNPKQMIISPHLIKKHHYHSHSHHNPHEISISESISAIDNVKFEQEGLPQHVIDAENEAEIAQNIPKIQQQNLFSSVGVSGAGIPLFDPMMIHKHSLHHHNSNHNHNHNQSHHLIHSHTSINHNSHHSHQLPYEINHDIEPPLKLSHPPPPPPIDATINNNMNDDDENEDDEQQIHEHLIVSHPKSEESESESL